MIRSTLRRLGEPLQRVSAIVLALTLFAGCDEGPTRHNSEVPQATAVRASPALPNMTELSAMSLTLPFSGTVNTSETAFSVTQTGIGRNAIFQLSNSSNGSPAVAASTKGAGAALSGVSSGLGSAAIVSATNSSNTSPAVQVSSWSYGLTGTASALLVSAFNTNSLRPTVNVRNYGKGTVLNVNHKGTVGDLAAFQVNEVNKIRFSRAGRGYFNGGTQIGGADLAEAFEVEGSVRTYEPGDVLTISETSDRTVEKAAEPYSTRVIGVYATRPGVLLTERDIDASLEDMIPLGVVGVIPTKVSAENGAIRRGDLLVTAPSAGYAMRGTDRRRMLGAVVGKALEEFSGPGRGVIRVFVNTR
jgi:hypothetical protein